MEYSTKNLGWKDGSETLLDPFCGGLLSSTKDRCTTFSEPSFSHCQAFDSQDIDFHWTIALKTYLHFPTVLFAVDVKNICLRHSSDP